VPAPVAGRWAGLLLATAYALLAGWGVPAQRTVVMIAVVVLLRQAGRRWPLPAVLGTAGFPVVAADPWALLQPGFWLSFVAVGLLAARWPPQPAAGSGCTARCASRPSPPSGWRPCRCCSSSNCRWWASWPTSWPSRW
jgi:competence protein ComEC